jgi:hypothetical protein
VAEEVGHRLHRLTFIYFAYGKYGLPADGADYADLFCTCSEEVNNRDEVGHRLRRIYFPYGKYGLPADGADYADLLCTCGEEVNHIFDRFTWQLQNICMNYTGYHRYKILSVQCVAKTFCCCAATHNHANKKNVPTKCRNV